MADETATLAAYVANLKFEDIPREVLERAKMLTLDFLGHRVSSLLLHRVGGLIRGFKPLPAPRSSHDQCRL